MKWVVVSSYSLVAVHHLSLSLSHQESEDSIVPVSVSHVDTHLLLDRPSFSSLASASSPRRSERNSIQYTSRPCCHYYYDDDGHDAFGGSPNFPQRIPLSPWKHNRIIVVLELSSFLHSLPTVLKLLDTVHIYPLQKCSARSIPDCQLSATLCFFDVSSHHL